MTTPLERQLADALRECASDLRGELNARYPPESRSFPCMEADYQADMQSVYEAEKLLAAYDASASDQQPADDKGEVVVTTNGDGACLFVSRQDEEGRILSVIWEAPTPESAAEIRKEYDATQAILDSMKRLGA